MKLWYNRHFLALLFICIFSIPALKSLAIPNFYSSHDGETHTARIAQYYQAIKDGQIPPRIAGSFYYGLGSPIFTYIYPLPYIAGSAIHSLGISYTDSFEIIMALGFIFSGIFCYFWLYEVFKSSQAAFIGALFYTWVPYRFLLIYVRGSISENLAYTFLPLVLLCLAKLKPKISFYQIALGAIAFAFFLWSQALVVIMSLPIIGAYIIFNSFFQKSKKIILQAGSSLIWGFCISAFTYLPSLLERHYIRFDQVFSLSYLDHFVNVQQLIRSPWGYGFSVSGTNDLLSFQIGLAHMLVITLFIGVVLVFYLHKFVKDIDKKQIILSIFFLIVLTFYLILMIPTSVTLLAWEHVPQLNKIDLPWRLLGIVALSSSFLAAFVAKSIRSGIFFMFLIAAVLIANRNHIRINETLVFDDAFFENYSQTATHLGEFTPLWRQSTRAPEEIDPNSHVQPVTYDTTISNIENSSNKISFNAATSQSEGQVRINKFFFPNWNVTVDGKKIEPQVTDSKSPILGPEKDQSGLMLITIPQGSHQVIAIFTETPLRLIADYLTIISFMAACIVIFWKNVKRQ